MKTYIEDEDKENELWIKMAKTIQPHQLSGFLKRLLTDYHHSYTSIINAISVGASATTNVMSKTTEGSVDGFQKNAIVLQYVENILFPNNKMGFEIRDFDKLLYPQSKKYFNNTISQDQANKLREMAEEKLKEGRLHIDVKEHLQKIIQGYLPFGLKIQH